MNCKKIIITFSISFFSLFFLYSESHSLKEIDVLIEQNEYNTALIYLNDFIKENPQKFDAAEKRIRKIMKYRMEYAEYASSFIDVLINEPQNDKLKLDMIAHLESLEKNPGNIQQSFLKQAKSAAQFTYFRTLFSNIMKDASKQVSEEKYVEATKTYLSGFDLYREDFQEQGYDSEIVQSVFDTIENIKADVADYEKIQMNLNSAYSSYLMALDFGEYENAARLYDDMKAQFSNFAKIRNDLAKNGNNLKKYYDELLLSFPDLTDASFIAFTTYFTLGRPNDSKTGLLGAMDYQWNNLVENMKKHALAATDKKSGQFSSMKAAYDKYDQAEKYANDIENFAAISKATDEIYELVSPETKNYSKEASLSYKDSLDVVSKYASSSMTLIEAMKLMTEEDLKIQNYGDIDEANVKDWVTSVTVYDKQLALSSFNESWTEKLDKWNGCLPHYKALNDDVYKKSKENSIDIWNKLGVYFSESGKKIFYKYNEDYKIAENLFSGQDLHFTSEAAEILKTLIENYADTKTALVSYSDTLSLNKMYPEITSASKKTIDDYIASLNKTYANAVSLKNKADEYLRLAERAKGDAENRYKQALASLEKDDFEGARKNLQKAREKYNESLSYNESEELRQESDSALSSLGIQIAQKENVLVIREVRELITEARGFYYNGNFENAENLLTRAKDRWSITNVEENQEINNLLSLVNNALSLKTGRTIPVTAPLYPEMSQILSMANKYFEQGKKQLKAGKKNAAMESFENARKKIHELQIVYPLNQEASLLSLKINQLIDPDAFTELFKLKVENAKQNYKNPDNRNSAYTDLLDLYEINPNYPGLKQLIYDVEIEIGIRRKPVDTSSKQKAEELAAKAKKLIESSKNNKGQLQTALNLLNESISLNPESSDTENLVDYVQAKVGGTASVVLSSADEASYNKAIQEYQRGNYIAAKTLVEQLLQKKSNNNSTKILELKKRVDALL